jgi:MFS family permease
LSGARLHHGWVVVLAAFTLMFLGFGAAYSFAAFFKAFQAEFEAPRAHVALVFSLSVFLWFVCGVPGGMIADRFGPRRVALAGVACLAAALAAASAARSLEMLYLTFSVGLGIGVGLTYVPSVGAVQPWFLRRRAFASGIAVAGIGAGNFAGPLLAVWWIDAFGWRGAYLAFALLTLVLGGAAAAAIDNDPARRGVAPDGAALPRERVSAGRTVHSGTSLGEALGRREFWLHFAGLLAVGVGTFVPMVHLGPYAQDAGHSAAAAVALVSLIGAGSLIGRFTVGALADRFGREASLVAAYAGLGAMLLVWWATRELWLLGVFAFVFGVCYGGYVALLPSIVMDRFGARAISGILGSLYLAPGIGTLIGPPLAGAAFDATGAYGASILGAAALAFAGAACVLPLVRR